MELVREYARHQSEAAFAKLIRRHVNLVYSVGLRFTRNPSDAEDVTQAVFVILARKATGLRPGTILTGWLCETARFTAWRWMRDQARLRGHEQEAHMQSTLENPPTAAMVEYYEQKDGIKWSRRVGIIRADANSTAWTFYEGASPTDTNLLQMAWKRDLFTVKGEP
jgi:RNA polymerase sigma factor (sigma-70 family)